jgi:cell division protein FtsI (penicillin-binding protein 3)
MIFNGRRLTVLLVMALAGTGLLWRAVSLQLNHKEFLQSEGDARHLRVVRITANRGKILDRNGEPLAISTPVDSVWANPHEFAAGRGRRDELAAILGVDAAHLDRLIAERLDREFVYFKRHVPPDVAAAVVDLKIPGVYLQREYRRYYPTGEVSAHVVGFTNVDDEGQEGLELAFDGALRGSHGTKRVLQDRYGQVVQDVEQIEPRRDGADLVLSIDKRIQYLAYRALKAGVRQHAASGGSVVVMDSRTGEILAMANQPSYNPNNGADRIGARFRNRAVTDVFEPGSTAKPFTIASALETGRFRPDTRIETAPGFFTVGRHRVSDLRNYGTIDVTTVIEKSSNVGASRIALALPPKQLWDTFSSVGFGAMTASGFPGETGGILPHFSEWSNLEQATLSFGYGFSVTPLQLAQAYCAIANGGWLYPVTFQKVAVPETPQRVLAAHAALQVRSMLEAVTGDGGTARRARVSGYRVAGKTGTVRKSTPGGYSEDRYVAVFAGMVPASAPRLVAVVVIDEPQGEEYYGGQVAAPVFAEVMAGALRLLGIAPDAPATAGAALALVDGEAPVRVIPREKPVALGGVVQ